MEEDELAKNWHNVRGLSLPPKALERLFILNGQVPMMNNDSHKSQEPQALQYPKGTHLNPPSVGFRRVYGCSSSDTLFLSGSEPSSWRRQRLFSLYFKEFTTSRAKWFWKVPLWITVRLQILHGPR